MRCPLCGSEDTSKVLYMGFPMKFCHVDECKCLWGFWSFIAVWMPLAPHGYFTFMGYTGSYWLALWYWLRYGVDGLNERR